MRRAGQGGGSAGLLFFKQADPAIQAPGNNPKIRCASRTREWRTRCAKRVPRRKRYQKHCSPSSGPLPDDAQPWDGRVYEMYEKLSAISSLTFWRGISTFHACSRTAFDAAWWDKGYGRRVTGTSSAVDIGIEREERRVGILRVCRIAKRCLLPTARNTRNTTPRTVGN